MIGTTGDCTLSAVVRCSGGHFYGEARAFDHPDPAITIPSGTTPKYVVKVEGSSTEDAIRALDAALVAQIGPLGWVRWRLITDKAD